MAYCVDWYLEGRIIMARLWDDTTTGDFDRAGETIAQFVDAGDEPFVHCIIDMRDINKAPTRLAVVQAAMKPMLSHPELGWSLPLIDDETQRYLCSMLAQIYKVRWREMPTPEAAIRFLIEVDLTLPPMLEPELS